MEFKKNLKSNLEKKTTKEEIKQCIQEGDYYTAAVLAENSGFWNLRLKILSKKYYNIAVERYMEKYHPNYCPN